MNRLLQVIRSLLVCRRSRVKHQLLSTLCCSVGVACCVLFVRVGFMRLYLTEMTCSCPCYYIFRMYLLTRFSYMEGSEIRISSEYIVFLCLADACLLVLCNAGFKEIGLPLHTEKVHEIKRSLLVIYFRVSEHFCYLICY